MSFLLREYNRIAKKYGLNDRLEIDRISSLIREYLLSFISEHRRVAIYCLGKHTKRLMADYIFEMKSIVCIIDNNPKNVEQGGYTIIRDSEIEQYNIDGIIVSSYKYKAEIETTLSQNHPNIEYLDIYDSLRNDGITLFSEYYNSCGAYEHYLRINYYNRLICKIHNINDLSEVYRKIIAEYFYIKDFRMASNQAGRGFYRTSDEEFIAMHNDFKKLYSLELEEITKLDNNNVIMICIDGLKASDFSTQCMPRLWNLVQNRGYYYSRAYSYSTSTFESLIPVYSGNSDLRTKYYEKNTIDDKDCGFILEAVQQGRRIFFYTDGYKYIDSNKINYKGSFETITERIWHFLLDAQNEKNGLFYLHHLYESHYSFPNPYTQGELIADGNAMLFDYLERNGGCLRTDYENQQHDAIRYIDDSLAPILERLSCRTVLYADHGNMVLREGTSLEDVDKQYLACHEDWLRIPFVVFSPEYGVGSENNLFTLMELSDIIISFLRKDIHISEINNWIKIGRSPIYNPDFIYLYKKMGEDHKLLAFEGFVFDNNEKLVIYSDGEIELYSCIDDKLIPNESRIDELFDLVKDYITVCQL